MNAVMRAMGGLLVILNHERQVVNINKTFLESIGVTDVEKALGLRLGEILHCVHAFEEPNGCGTTRHCATCGAAIAMMATINENKTAEAICALSSQHGESQKEMSLLVRSQPITIDKQSYTLIFAQDITQQQFWVNLEQVFFHDINNTLTSLVGNTELMASKYPNDTESRHAYEAAIRLSKEVQLQRSLSQKKDAAYLVRRAETSTKALQADLEAIIASHEAAKNKKIEFVWPEENHTFLTDPLLVSRILSNMLINALESTEQGGLVRVSAHMNTDEISWRVWNDSYIPEKIQPRIFQRHFSTKSDIGRGLGTYSMKLFGETYLSGKISFLTNQSEGTTFQFSLPLL